MAPLWSSLHGPIFVVFYLDKESEREKKDIPILLHHPWWFQGLNPESGTWQDRHSNCVSYLPPSEGMQAWPARGPSVLPNLGLAPQGGGESWHCLPSTDSQVSSRGYVWWVETGGLRAGSSASLPLPACLPSAGATSPSFWWLLSRITHMVVRSGRNLFSHGPGDP